MTGKSDERKFVLELTVDKDGRPHIMTRNQGLSYDTIVSALSQQLHLYNSMWAKKSSLTLEEK